MSQILALYIGMAIIVCHFFRKFCQDPEDDNQDEEPINAKDLE